MTSHKVHFLENNFLILGAGSHKPYSFPTSADLNKILRKILTAGRVLFISDHSSLEHRSEDFVRKIKICRAIASENTIKQESPKLGSNSYDIYIGDCLDSFLTAFASSNATSIDSYLSTLKNSQDERKKTLFSKIGKILISYLISEAENLEPLGCQDPNWIQFFIKEYIEPNPHRFFEHAPQIVTFNYDRLLEQFIYGHLVEFHHMQADVAEKYVSSLNIVHVYGALGHFKDWRSRDTHFYANAARNIKVIGEERDEKKILETKQIIQQRLYKCNKIYFLGYGFDPLNNKIIFEGLASNWREGKFVVATNVGIGKRDINRVKQELGFTPGYLRQKEPVSIDCLDILKNRFPLEQQAGADDSSKEEKPKIAKASWLKNF